jgi:hypothetical protein
MLEDLQFLFFYEAWSQELNAIILLLEDLKINFVFVLLEI